ncbi:MAG: endonuclease MutS2 [Thermodesulfovibrio sp.]|nr:endonuclease MutS2 [Thermodesulfovibrio sp.]
MIKKKALQELDYFRILNLIKEFSNSEATAKAIKQIYPFVSIEDAEAALKEFEEIKEYFDKGGEIPLSSFPDISDLIQRASKEGVFFEAWELTKFLGVLRILDRIYPYIDKLLAFPNLTKKIKDLLGNYLSVGQPYLLERLENTVDEEGNILDTASSMLKYLRRQIKIIEERIKEKLEEIINRKEINVFLQDRFITKRNDRWVIPIRMDSKGQIKGKVQDISRSGETAFIEPEEISILSKKLEELKIEERVEEIRILRELSHDIHQISKTLEKEFSLLIYLDKLHSIYRFSNKFNANICKLTREKHIRLIDAKHPLLMLSKDRVEPLNLDLREKTILVITGPNAGGKTVTIKTVGLLTAMANAGLPVPASPSSLLPFVSSIYVDLYHEGSIEEHLSSFATHVVTLRDILQEADQESLVLLDEIGTNTDPEEGSALACAIIEELRDRGCFTFVTTHLSKVKLFAATQEGLEIAAMLFDEKTMTPLYRLSMGSLTTSYALEVAKKYGFPERLIKRAYELKGTEDKKIYELMKELEKTKEEYRIKIEETENMKNVLLAEKERLEKELIRIDEKRKKVIEEAKMQAHSMLIKLKKEINLLYEETKKADRRRLKELSQRVTEISKEFQPEDIKKIEEITVGDLVKIRSLNLSGRVLKVEERRAKIQTDTAQIETTLEELEKIANIDEAKQGVIFANKVFTKVNKEDYTFRKLDIRGMRVDEALSLVERFLNELSLGEISKGLIIHGIGKGILRDAIREYLKGHPIVKTFQKGNPDEGGEAVTVVELR